MSSKPFAILTDRGSVVRMSTIDRFLVQKEDSKGAESRVLTEDKFTTAYGEYSLKQPLYSPEVLINAAKLNVFQYRCAKTKAFDVAGLGWSLNAKGEGEKEPAGKEELTSFFNTAAGDDSTLDAELVKCWYDYEAIGYLFLEVVRVENSAIGKPELLNHIPAHTVRIHVNRNKYMQQRGTRKVWFKKFGYKMDVDKKDGKEYELGTLSSNDRASEALYIRNYDPQSDYYGSPDIISALSALLGMQSLNDYNISFFQTYGVPSYAIYITGDYDLGDKDADGEYEIIKQIKVHLEEIKDHPHSPLIIAIPTPPESSESKKVEIKFDKLTTDVKEASFKMYRKDTRDEIIVANGMIPYRIGVYETGQLAGNIAQEAAEIYKNSVIAPRKNILNITITNKIIKEGFENENWEFWLEDLDISDEDHDKEICDFLFARGAMTPNQLINYFGERFGLQPVEDEEAMNYHYINNEPIELGQQTVEKFMKAMKDIHDRLAKIAIKDSVYGNN